MKEIAALEKNVPAPALTYDIDSVYNDFPILHKPIRDKELIFLDNAASTQKPQIVIDTIHRYYKEENANIHRGVYYLSEVATRKYEEARETVRAFLNAASDKEIIFTSGTTDSINLVANGFGREFFKPGDEILITTMEHHSNIVPWQMICEDTGAKLRVAPINDQGELLLDELAGMINSHTKLISVVYVSNSLGTVNPVEKIISLARDQNIPVLLDAAQAVAHTPIDVQKLDCDFLAFSSHKIFGPTGVGVLYGKEKHLEKMRPFKGGGDMIRQVTFEKTTYNELPHKFEAGTPNMAGVIGLASALDYVTSVGLEKIHAYEKMVLEYGTELLSDIDELRLIGTAAEKSGAISFIIENIHPHDIGTWVDRDGIAIRAGHHCTQPVMDRLCIPATSRASIALYNRKSDFDALASSLKTIIEVFR